MDISNNYILIQGWMISKLNLSGNNLLLYALIYGFSQDEQSKFTGSLKYICKRINCSKPTAIKSLRFLMENGLIKKKYKTVNGIILNEYSITKTSDKNETSNSDNNSELNKTNVSKPLSPHRCPVCNGNGLVPNGFYMQTSGHWSTNSITPETCRSCNRTGVVWV